jgi:hypothetical protein
VIRKDDLKMTGKISNHWASLNITGLLLAANCMAAGASADAPPTGASAQSVPSTLPTTVIGMLSADDFWATSSDVAERPLDQASLAELQRLSVAADRPALRLRATKLLCELNGNSRVDPSFKKDQAAHAVAVAFAWLEGHLADPEVAKYAPEAGFTHVTVSRMSGEKDDIWVLIETAALPPGFNGGLNVRFNPKTDTVSEVKHWGATRAK